MVHEVYDLTQNCFKSTKSRNTDTKLIKLNCILNGEKLGLCNKTLFYKH